MPVPSTTRSLSNSAQLLLTVAMLTAQVPALAATDSAGTRADWQLVQSAPSRSGVAAKASGMEESLVAVDVNRQREKEAVLILRDQTGQIYVSAASLDRWRITTVRAPMIDHENERYFLLSAVPGVRYRFDEARLTLAIDAEARAFKPSEFTNADRPRVRVTPPTPGAFFNYDLSSTKTEAAKPSSAGLFELGLFSAQGVLTTSAVARDETTARSTTRLDTTFTRDWIDDLSTLRLGDLASRPGTWGRALRIGGIQYGSNFATQPGFIRSPTLNAVGQAALPSVVDVFVNNAFVARRDVPPGPFSIGNIPPVSGPGAVNLIVTDILGRQQVISQPFYTSATLLAPGISDFSMEGGFIRRDFGLSSNRYGEFASAAAHRYGWNKYLTTELHAEGAASARTLGGGLDYVA
ncbi:MAG: fimbria/pilus outer membrane usher protein, partial [Burkholderiales bacterium]